MKGKYEHLILRDHDFLHRNRGFFLGNFHRTGRLGACPLNYIRVINEKRPRALNNDEGYPNDVGFATTGGRELGQIAQVMFKAAQYIKEDKFCKWILVEEHYCTVWITVDTEIHHPVFHDQARHLLHMHNRFPANARPFLLNPRQITEMHNKYRYQPPPYLETHLIPPLDEPGDDKDHGNEGY